MKARMKDL